MRHHVESATNEPRQAADGGGHQHRHRGRRETDQQRQASAVDVATQEVAPRVIGSQQMLGRGALQSPGHVLALLGVRCQQVGEDAHQHDDDGAEQAQRLLPDQPVKEIRKWAAPASRFGADGISDGVGDRIGNLSHW